MDHKILLVDDELNVLDGLKRVLGRDFGVTTASGGDAALKLMAKSAPFAVVMSDMRMPGMNGVQLLTAVREKWPDTVRLMLTGNADIQTAVDAVNEGCVFRFLTKPCPQDTLKEALRAALAQYNLITAEKELLEKTLYGSVKVLTDILALVNPAAFSRTSRIHQMVKHMVEHLGLQDGWRYEIAAMLSQVGCVALDAETVEAVYAGLDLPVAERERFKMHPSIAFELLGRIPRLEIVADMIAGQGGPPPGAAQAEPSAVFEPVALGGQLLKIAVDLDQLLLRGVPEREALRQLRNRPAEYYAAAVAALESFSGDSLPSVSQEISIREMSVGMIVDEDLRLCNGTLLAARNQEITFPLLVRIRSAHQKTPMTGPIRVKVPPGAQPPRFIEKEQAVLTPDR